MAIEYVSELGDKLSNNNTASNLPKHIKVISAPNYQRTDNGVVTNPSLQTALDGKAPTAHASTATTYGVGSSANYGHVKLYDNVTGSNTDGAPTQKAVKEAIAAVEGGKVKATAKSDNVNYKLLATASDSPTSGALTEAVYDTDITLNPSTNTINASIARTFASSSSTTVSETPIITVSGSTDGFKLTYGSETADTGITKLFTTDDANAKLSFGNMVSSTYKEALAISNGSANLTGTVNGYTIGKSVPSDAKFTDTTYTANNGVSLSGTTFSNSGVRSTTINGNYLRVNTGGTNADLTIPYATSAHRLRAAYATFDNTTGYRLLAEIHPATGTSANRIATFDALFTHTANSYSLAHIYVNIRTNHGSSGDTYNYYWCYIDEKPAVSRTQILAYKKTGSNSLFLFAYESEAVYCGVQLSINQTSDYNGQYKDMDVVDLKQNDTLVASLDSSYTQVAATISYHNVLAATSQVGSTSVPVYIKADGTVDTCSLGTAALKDVPASGDASSTQVVLGDDTRLNSENNKKYNVYNNSSSEVCYKVASIAASQNNPANVASGALFLIMTRDSADYNYVYLAHIRKRKYNNDYAFIGSISKLLGGNFPIQSATMQFYVDKTSEASADFYIKLNGYCGMSVMPLTYGMAGLSSMVMAIASLPNTATEITPNMLPTVPFGGAGSSSVPVYVDSYGNAVACTVGSSNGLASLDANGKVPTSQLPNFGSGTVTSVATGVGLRGGTITDSGTISTNVPRNPSSDVNSPFPTSTTANTMEMQEYNGGTQSHCPSNTDWWHILSTVGSDTAYKTQLAQKMSDRNTPDLCIRVLASGTWGDWFSTRDASWIRTGTISTSRLPLNSSSSAGIVASGSGQQNKVWMTDSSGNPSWSALPQTISFSSLGNTSQQRVIARLAYVANDQNSVMTLMVTQGESFGQEDSCGIYFVQASYRGTPSLRTTVINRGSSSGSHCTFAYYTGSESGTNYMYIVAKRPDYSASMTVTQIGAFETDGSMASPSKKIYDGGTVSSSGLTDGTVVVCAVAPFGGVGSESTPIFMEDTGTLKPCTGGSLINYEVTSAVPSYPTPGKFYFIS